VVEDGRKYFENISFIEAITSEQAPVWTTAIDGVPAATVYRTSELTELRNAHEIERQRSFEHYNKFGGASITHLSFVRPPTLISAAAARVGGGGGGRGESGGERRGGGGGFGREVGREVGAGRGGRM